MIKIINHNDLEEDKKKKKKKKKKSLISPQIKKKLIK